MFVFHSTHDVQIDIAVYVFYFRMSLRESYGAGTHSQARVLPSH